MKVVIDQAKKTATIILSLLDQEVQSSSGDTFAIAEKANNVEVGGTTAAGHPVKLSVNLYRKATKAEKDSHVARMGQMAGK